MTGIPTPEAGAETTGDIIGTAWHGGLNAAASTVADLSDRYAREWRADRTANSHLEAMVCAADECEAAIRALAFSPAAPPRLPIIPAPRRYTGGPLEDGQYLYRLDHWPADLWEAQRVGPLYRLPFWFVDPGQAIWLIGPIPIPDIPSEETSS